MSTKTDEQHAAEWDARIDIREPIAQIALLLDVPYNDIAEITFRPTDVTVITFKRNEQGLFYIDETTRETARETHEFKTIA
jgi:hypothetical protein